MSPRPKSLPESLFAKKHKYDYLVKTMSNIGIGLSVINKEMRIVWANRPLTDVFGSLEKIAGKHCYQLYNHRKKICPNCPTKKVFRTGKSGFEATQLGFDTHSARKYFHLTTTPIRHNGSVAEVLEVCEDVTKEVMAERQKKQFQRQLKRKNLQLSSINKSLALKTRRLNKASKEVKGLNRSLREQIRNKNSELNIAIKELSTVYTVSREVISTLDLQEVFSFISKTVCSIINTKACILRMVDEEKKHMIIVASHGISAKYIDSTPLKIGEGLSGIIAKTGQPIVCPQVNKEESVKHSYYMNKEGYQSALGVPIIFNGETLGSIVTCDEAVRNYTKTEVMLLSTFASQIAVAIKNAQLHSKVHLDYLDTVSALALAVEARDPYTHGHSERVTAYAIELARAVSLPKSKIKVIQNCGRLHDVGKIAISDTILRKPGPLTENERAVIQLHPLKGVHMLAPLKFLELGFPLIQHHHERFDGTGYPQGLKKTDIPIIARIFACADAFDAMTSDRPYRSKMTIKEGIKELEKNAGSQFDPYLVKIFVPILRHKKLNFD